ncbi:MAG: hypothetical protein NUV48_14085 [Peptococcaceae bacterium]|jgi:hypothetical protein|nr:hypothetical protein [Peptococcaceae bacterium]
MVIFLLILEFSFLLLALLLAGAFLYWANRNAGRKRNTSPEPGSFKKAALNRHVDEVIEVDDVKDGLIYRRGRVYALARVEGANFSVMSPGEQDARERALVEIFSRLDYPVQFITNTVVADTVSPAQRIAEAAREMPEGNLRNYAFLYASFLEQMRVERLAMAQQSYLVVCSDGHDGNPEKTVIERVMLLESALRERAGIVLTPITTGDGAIDAIQNIVQPEKIVKPSKLAHDGIPEPVHFSSRGFFENGTF